MAAANIDEVLSQLDDIIAEERRLDSVLGYFAAMYRQVTRAVKHGIDNGDFDDGARMDRLDTTFANYYLDALALHKRGRLPSRPWQVAFAFSDNNRKLIAQHLFLGMNAHINFDLAQACADTAPGAAIDDLENDYDHINRILRDLMDPLQGVIDSFSPALWVVDVLGGRSDEALFGWTLVAARDHAWKHARELARGDGDRDAILAHMETISVTLGEQLSKPRGLLRVASGVARTLEKADTRAIIDALGAVRHRSPA